MSQVIDLTIPLLESTVDVLVTFNHRPAESGNADLAPEDCTPPSPEEFEITYAEFTYAGNHNNDLWQLLISDPAMLETLEQLTLERLREDQ